MIRLAAPIYVKLGLRNAPNIYPAGLHLADVAAKLGRERVRRAEARAASSPRARAGARRRPRRRPAARPRHSRAVRPGWSGPGPFALCRAGQRQAPTEGQALDAQAPQLGSRVELRASSTVSISRPDESTCSRARTRAAWRSRRRSRPDRAVLGRSRVELVELGRRAPHATADEGPPRPFASRSTSGSSAAAVDDVVEGVVRLHPLDEERRRRRASRAPARAARA